MKTLRPLAEATLSSSPWPRQQSQDSSVGSTPYHKPVSGNLSWTLVSISTRTKQMTTSTTSRESTSRNCRQQLHRENTDLRVLKMTWYSRNLPQTTSSIRVTSSAPTKLSPPRASISPLLFKSTTRRKAPTIHLRQLLRLSAPSLPTSSSQRLDALRR